jgi:hypothetical protein
VTLTGVNRPPVPPTPLSPPFLLGEVRRIRNLLEELARFCDPGLPPGLEAFQRDVELALGRPESLDSAQNQLDFIEELASAVWEEPLLTGHGDLDSLDASGPQAHCDQLDRLSEFLCREAESWHRRRTFGAAGTPQFQHSQDPFFHTLSTDC